MRKIKFIVTALLASTLGLASCGSDVKEPEQHEVVDLGVDSVVINNSFSKMFIDDDPVKLAVTVETHKDVEKTVTWASSDEEVATVGEDGTVTPVGYGTVTITAKSTVDAEKSASFTFVIEKSWSKEDRALLMSYFGELVPFFDADFVWTEEYFSEYQCLTAESEAEDKLDDLVALFDGLDDWVGGYDEDNDLYAYTKVCDGDPDHILLANIYVGYAGLTLDVYKQNAPITEWPTALVEEFLGDSTCDRPVPVEDGDEYLYSIKEADPVEGTPATFNFDIYGADMDAYVELLEQAGYAFDYYYYDYYGIIMAVSANRSLYVQLRDYSTDFLLTFYDTGLSLPTQTAWTQDEQTMMTTYLGEVLPFANLGFEWADFWDEDQLLQAQSEYPIVIGEMAEAFTEEDGWTTVYDDYYGDYTITKATSTGVLTISLFEYYGLGIMQASVETFLTDWTDADKTLMNTELGELLPFFSGNFEWETHYGGGIYGEQTSSNCDFESVCDVFAEAGWTVKESYSDEVDYKKNCANKEGYEMIAAVVDDYWTGAVCVTVTLHKLPLTSWPATELAEILGDKTEETTPAYTGTGLEFEISASTISANKANISIKNGNIETYIGILENAGFTAESPLSGGYAEYLSPEKTIMIYLSQDSDTLLSLTIKAQDAPVSAEWPMDAIKSSCNGKEVPAPNVFTSATVTAESPLQITVVGADFDTYLGELSDAGLQTYQYNATSYDVWDNSFDIYFTLDKVSDDTITLTWSV